MPGVSSIIKVIEGEPLPPPAPRTSSQSGSDSDGFGQLLGAGFVIFMIGNILLRQLLGRLPSGLIVGGVIGMLAWVMLLSLAWAIAAGVVAFVLSLALRTGWTRLFLSFRLGRWQRRRLGERRRKFRRR